MTKITIIKNNPPMTVEAYYDMACSGIRTVRKKDLSQVWYDLFKHMMRKLAPELTDNTLESLFLGALNNWEVYHIENHPKYGRMPDSKARDKELLEAFFGEVHYICDRLSFDRVNRTHWLFLNSLNQESRYNMALVSKAPAKEAKPKRKLTKNENS